MTFVSRWDNCKLHFVHKYETANVLTFFNRKKESVQVGDEAIVELSLYSKESGTVPAQFAEKLIPCLVFIVF